MIKKIKLSNFRLFKKLDLVINNPFVIFSGKNAVGKTSILESIFIASTTKSHRTNDLKDVIKFDSSFSEIEIDGDKKFKVVISKDGKNFFINNSQIKKLGDYIGNLNAIFISPSDISVVDGTAQDKRKFLDLNISMIDKKYLYESLKYKKLLNERNVLLKEGNPDLVMLNILTSELIESLKLISSTRIKFIDELNYYLDLICKSMDIEKIKLIYEPTYNLANIEGSFKSKLNNDLLYKLTSIGSHRDSFKILIDELDAKTYGSNGQLRITYIVLKLALKEIITKYSEEPILLLDDIFQALDSKKIKGITSYVKAAKQVFITTTSVLEIPDDILKESYVIRLEGELEQNGKGR